MAGQGQALPASFKFEQFGGMLPAWDDLLLPPGQAADAENTYLQTGTLAGWRTPKLLHTLVNSNAKMAYRLPTLTESRASAIAYFLQALPDGFTVEVGEETYTFRTAVSAAYDVKIGGSIAESATNFFAALTLDNGANTGAGTLYGVGTYANPSIDQSGPPTRNIVATDIPRVHVFAPEIGEAYNTIGVSSINTSYIVWRKADGATATNTLAGGANLTFNPAVTGSSTWLEFDDPDTDIMRSPVVDDEYDRYYFASPSLPPRYNTRARLEAGSAHWLLGVPAPNCSPGVVVDGGGDAVVLGYNEDGASGGSANLAANIIYLIPFTPDGNTTLIDVTGFTVSAVTDLSYAAVLFDDDGNGAPNTLLNVGIIGTSTTTVAGTIQSAFQNPTGLLANTRYWIGMMLDKAQSFAISDRSGVPANAGITISNTFGNGPPSTVTAYNSNQPTLAIYGNGTSDDVLSARSYVYTYVTEYGEESAPSPATVESGWSNGIWTISLFTPPPDQMGVTRNITKIKLYRTVTALAGATTYFFVAEMPVTTATYVDILSDDEVVVNAELISQLWTPPPFDLQGLVSLPNGMMAGWRSNEIWFCEPYRPHAWPTAYVLTTEYPIVGLGVSGSAVVACTAGSPYIANGVSPGTMSTTKIQTPEPCLSRGSIIGLDEGVYYTSPNGLIQVSQYGAVKNTTASWTTREKWQQLTPQKNVRAVFLAGGYYALGCVRNGDTSVAQQGFTCELINNEADQNAGGLEPSRHRMGFNRLTAPNGVNVDNVRLDPWSSVCLIIQNGGVFYIDFSDAAPTMQVYTWRSKKFQQKSKENFAACRIKFSIPSGTPALNATRLEEPTDDAVWVSGLPADRYGFLRIYAGDDNLVTAREIRRPMETLRILSGFKHETWWFEIEARVPVANLQIATSVKALAQT